MDSFSHSQFYGVLMIYASDLQYNLNAWFLNYVFFFILSSKMRGHSMKEQGDSHYWVKSILRVETVVKTVLWLYACNLVVEVFNSLTICSFPILSLTIHLYFPYALVILHFLTSSEHIAIYFFHAFVSFFSQFTLYKTSLCPSLIQGQVQMSIEFLISSLVTTSFLCAVTSLFS